MYLGGPNLADDKTGIEDDPQHNEAALRSARLGLEECAVTTPP